MQSPYVKIPPPPPPPATAINLLAGPFFLELQLKATKFCELIANRLRIEPICLSQKLVNPVTGKPGLVVDRISFPEGVKLQWAPQPQGPALLELRIAVRIHFLDYKSDARFPISFDVFFSLTAKGSQVCVTFRGTDLPQELAGYADALTDMLGGVDLCGTLNLGALLRFLGGGAAVEKTHITATGGVNIVVLRLLVGDPAAGEAGWANFRDAEIHPMFVGKEDWVLLVDSDLLVATAKQEVTDGFASQNDISLDHVRASWSAAPTLIYVRDPQFGPGFFDPGKTKLLHGAISIKIEGTSYKVCNIGFDASAIVGVEVDKPDTLKMTTRIDWSPNYWDAFWCLGPLGGLLVGGLLDIIAGAISPDLPSSSLCTRTSDHVVECDYPVTLPPLDFGAPSTLATFTLTSYRPTTKFVVLAGTLSLAEVIRPELSLERSPFAWGVQGSCDHFFLGASASVVIASLPPLNTTSCRIEVIDDELKFFAPRMVIDPANSHLLPRTVSFTIELDSVSPDDPYWSAPYPLHLLVQTTAGAAVVHLGVLPPQPEGADLTTLQLSLASAQTKCTQAQNGLFGANAGFNLHWIADPESGAVILWNGAINHATPGSTFELLDREGRVVGSSNVGLDGSARLAAHSDGSGAQPIRIVRRSQVADDSRANAINAQKAALTQRQRRLAPRGVVRLADVCRSIQLELFDRLVILTAATKRGVEFYDISAPDRPSALLRVATTRFRGALPWGSGILYWGNEGAWSSTDGSRIGQPIIGAEPYGDFLVVLAADGISLHDRNLRALRDLKVENTGHMTRAGRLLAISTRSGLTIIDLTDVKRPAIAGSIELPPVKAITSGKVFDTTTTVIALHEHGATLVEAKAQPRILTHYDHRPWAAQTCTVGEVWAHLTDDSMTVNLYTLLETSPNIPLSSSTQG